MASGQEKPFEIKNQGLYSSVSEHEVVLKHYPDIQIVTTVFLINKVNNIVMGLHTHNNNAKHEILWQNTARQ